MRRVVYILHIPHKIVYSIWMVAAALARSWTNVGTLEHFPEKFRHFKNVQIIIHKIALNIPSSNDCNVRNCITDDDDSIEVWNFCCLIWFGGLLHAMNLIWILSRKHLDVFFLSFLKLQSNRVGWEMAAAFYLSTPKKLSIWIPIAYYFIFGVGAVCKTSNNRTDRKKEIAVATTAKVKHAMTMDDSKIQAHTAHVRKVWPENVCWICN